MNRISFAFLGVFLFLSSLASAQFVATMEVSNPTLKINDGAATVTATGGQAPYVYFWSNSGTSIYSNSTSGLTEGGEVSVRVVDATGAEVEVKGIVSRDGMEEMFNTGALPVVNAIGAVFFWDPFAATGLYDPTIYVDASDLTAPHAGDTTKAGMVLSNWLVAEGDSVWSSKTAIAELTVNGEKFNLIANATGVVSFKATVGQEVISLVKEEGEAMSLTNAAVICSITNQKGTPLLAANHSPQTQGIPLIVVWLVLGAIFFTFRMGFINFRGFGHAFSLVRGKYDNPNDKGEVSHFQALTTALSATVGLGNIAGVAVAVAAGGAGATFWMILAGLLGMASKFVECTLGVKYREINEDGEVSGGPMYYLSKGLKKRGLGRLGIILAVMFSVLCIGGSFGGGNMFQANQAWAQVSGKFGLEGGGFWFGIIMAGLVGVVIIGGIRSIAKVTDKIVPFMVGLYVLFALIIIFMNISHVGEAFGAIFDGAFSAEAFRGGVIGVLIIGFQRAAFSNEAGVGSASIAHSASKTNEPVSEGIVALLEPFIDTVVVCTMTALVLIFTGYATDTGGLQGSELTSAAFSQAFPWFSWVLMVAILLFAFSTMISWSYYGQKAWTYLFGLAGVKAKWTDYAYKGIFLLFVVVGSSVSLGAVLDFSDLMVLGMAFPNILGLILMSGEVKADLKDYLHRVKTGVIKKYK